MPPTVAIIMRAKNEMPHVQRSLAMLQGQVFRDFDLFAVDSGSTDGTLDVLRTCCDEDRITRIAAEDYVPGKVLNDAIARTGHDVVVLLNADAVPLAKTFLQDLLHPILENEADAVFAKQVARPDARFIVAYDYQRAYSPEAATPDFFSAAACAFRRDLWEQHRFREQGYAEDRAWARACLSDGARIRFVPNAAVEHSHNYTLGELYRKRRRQAATFGGSPHPARQAYRCMREIVRDCIHACRTFKLRTIPYNVAYRVTIHAGLYRGLREGAS